MRYPQHIKYHVMTSLHEETMPLGDEAVHSKEDIKTIGEHKFRY